MTSTSIEVRAPTSRETYSLCSFYNVKAEGRIFTAHT